MQKIENFLKDKLQKRMDDFSIRNLSRHNPPIDFCSNDYLGFAQSNTIYQKRLELLSAILYPGNGAGGSRLLSGNHAFTEETEAYIANYHQAAAGLIFNSGYDANIGLLSCLPQRGDTLITDELIHASLIDGARLSHATRYKFLHNNLDDLEAKLKHSTGNIFVVVESVYSMDGDQAPLPEMVSLCEKYNANLIVDEAHATGIFGDKGKGLVNAYGLENQVFARVITFGKALGSHGAIVLGSQNLRHYLINFARSFIYTTALPLEHIAGIKAAYLNLPTVDLTEIHQKILLFNQLATENQLPILNSKSAIQGLILGGNEKTKQVAQQLQQLGFDVRAILSPTVAKGKERIRICLHQFNSNASIAELINHLKNLTS